jgi:hypothetical protein
MEPDHALSLGGGVIDHHLGVDPTLTHDSPPLSRYGVKTFE